MEFLILGPLEVVKDGKPLELGGRQQRALLVALLLDANRIVSSDRLLEILWGAAPPATAVNALHVHVSHLRKLLGRERVVTRPPGYELRVHQDELDLERFERLWAEGRMHDALAQWRSEPLPEFSFHASIGGELAHLKERRMVCLERRIDADLEAGRHEQLVPELEALNREHPLREGLRTGLMLALYRSHRQAEALQVYQDARQLLTLELGIEPDRSLRELQQAILRQESSLDVPESVAAAEEMEPTRDVFISAQSTSGPPEVRYVRSGDVNIAYQIIGDGPVDLVFVPGFISNLESAWWHPSMAAFYWRLARFSRLIVFDKRGTGMSDRSTGIADLETRMDDVRAVMDAARSTRAVLLGYSEGASMAALFAATYPERTLALLMYGALVALRWSPETPWAVTSEDFDRWIADIETRWGTPEYCDEQLRVDGPSRAHDDEFRRWYATRLRLGASPSAAAAAIRMAAQSDIAAILPAIRVPTLILHRSGDRLVPVFNGRYLGARIPAARYVELPGDDHLPWVGDHETLALLIESFLAEVGGGKALEPDRAITTVLVIDIDTSTQNAVEPGDGRREPLERQRDLIRRQLAHYRGRELDTNGDGFLASFDGPARAIRCACSISDGMRAAGVGVRIGLHTGECELSDANLGGIAVDIGTGIAAEAKPGEVLVSATLKDLVAGSEIKFLDRGTVTLTGMHGQRQLFAVDPQSVSAHRAPVA